MAALIMLVFTAPHVGARGSCSAACEKRVKAREFAKHHGGCRSMTCVKRVRAKRDARDTRRLTPYRCRTGRFAVPCYIIRCESRGSWTAYNRSGAAGPYQIMPMHGRPWPAHTQRARLAHHRIAARLWRGGAGASNWVCA